MPLGGRSQPFTGVCQRWNQSYCSQGDLGFSGLSITKSCHRSKQAFSDSICQSSKPHVQRPSSTLPLVIEIKFSLIDLQPSQRVLFFRTFSIASQYFGMSMNFGKQITCHGKVSIKFFDNKSIMWSIVHYITWIGIYSYSCMKCTVGKWNNIMWGYGYV